METGLEHSASCPEQLKVGDVTDCGTFLITVVGIELLANGCQMAWIASRKQAAFKGGYKMYGKPPEPRFQANIVLANLTMRVEIAERCVKAFRFLCYDPAPTAI